MDLTPKSLSLVIVFAAVVATAQPRTIDLTGTIVNQSGIPVEGLVVALGSAGVVDTTDSAGRFHLVRRGAAAQPPTQHTRAPVRTSPGGVSFTVEGEAMQMVKLTLYKPDGRRVRRLFDGALAPGRHTLPLHRVDRSTAAGGFVALLERGDRSSTIRMTAAGKGLWASTSETRSHTTPASVTSVAVAETGFGPALPAIDSLTVVHGGIDTHSVGIPVYQGDLAIGMDLVPHLIVELAMAEESRCPAEVGRDLVSYPGALKRYLRRTGRDTCDYEAWCSEFVSWAYLAAGVPFTEGREGGWMFTYSMAIRNWFSRNARFVARTDPAYENFVPAPGDYIRYRNNWGGHSGIVRKVEGTTLYTIEGNIGNRVVRRTIRNYKARTDIDGFGMRSGTRGTSVVVTKRDEV